MGGSFFHRCRLRAGVQVTGQRNHREDLYEFPLLSLSHVMGTARGRQRQNDLKLNTGGKQKSSTGADLARYPAVSMPGFFHLSKRFYVFFNCIYQYLSIFRQCSLYLYYICRVC